MREILFRGISKDTKTMVVGDLAQWGKRRTNIYVNSLDGVDLKYGMSIEPKTLGEFTGFYDKNKKRIFEGDIVKDHTDKPFEIRMCNGCWVMWDRTAKFAKWDYLHSYIEFIEVIGNIHENPELLKEGVKND